MDSGWRLDLIDNSIMPQQTVIIVQHNPTEYWLKISGNLKL
ncbi:hypothetical protein C5167_028115 [Papaver somniferum]|nr:hypothetical protein C5167_028115 [Papaver somniferum]